MPASTRVRHVLSLATELSANERAEVAAELIAGLDDDAPAGEVPRDEWERTRRDEIVRRLADRKPGIPWSKARAQVHRALEKAQRAR